MRNGDITGLPHKTGGKHDYELVPDRVRVAAKETASAASLRGGRGGGQRPASGQGTGNGITAKIKKKLNSGEEED